MLLLENLSKLELISITKIEQGHIIANLGRVIEKTEDHQTISLVILRMNQKLVLNFNKKLDVVIIPPDYYIASNNE